MIVYPFPQRSPAWQAVRCGRVTASAAERYFAPGKRTVRKNRAGDDLADGVWSYIYELLDDWYFGVPSGVVGSSGYMRRGTEMEAQARAAYELVTMTDVEECGFIGSDCGRYGCSVDGLAGADGLVEIKVLGSREHLRTYHVGGERAVAQAQAQMADTGRAWVDRFFWHPDPRLYIPPMRTVRDDGFIAKLLAARHEVAERLGTLQERHIREGFKPAEFDPAKWDENGEPIFDGQLEPSGPAMSGVSSTPTSSIGTEAAVLEGETS